MYQAVIFDMDGVIIDSEIVYYNWLKELLAEKGAMIPERELKKIVGLSNSQSLRMMMEWFGREKGRKLWETYCEEEEGYDLSYKEIVNPGVKELLKLLREHHVKLALASSSAMEEILEILDETGLKDYFPVILSGEMFQESKPNPEIYIETMKQLDVTPGKCIVIEDSDYGIYAAKSAGAYVIAHEENRFGFKQQLADHIAHDMYHVKDIIRTKFNLKSR
ncbi:HAD family hydrolase [Anaerostipes sp.]|uniref:HAD family hydrolase n=1 Tax=Anaerostipes sp. TaxID=1872530 RepID=UPI0025C5967D|nr:HAD family phosphatase [Anaerostipes sp.]MBS7009125.1 HAD family phosphatase [Anaerostipes sp.]